MIQKLSRDFFGMLAGTEYTEEHAGSRQWDAAREMAELAAKTLNLGKVHNHGVEEGDGLNCIEIRLVDGRLVGVCMMPADIRERIKA